MSGRMRIVLLLALQLTGLSGLFAQERAPVLYDCPPTAAPAYGLAQIAPDGIAVRDNHTPFYQGMPVGYDGIVTEQLPEDSGGFYGESPADIFLSRLVKNTWVRLEYLHWNFDRPGDALLGTAVQGVVDPREPFVVTVGTQQDGVAHVEDLGDLYLRDNQGLRVTVGIPFTTGSIEANAFSFQSGTDSLERIIDPPPTGTLLQEFVATSTFLNGQQSQNLFLYDQSFRADFESDLWGAEVNYLADPLVPGEGFKIRPLVGFHYWHIEERLTQVGVFDQNGYLVDSPLVSTIDSQAGNRIYAPQLGLRMELVHKWFTIGFEPKIAFGVNVFDAQVLADQIRGFDDPTVVTKERGEKFAPVGDFEVNGRIHVTDALSFFLSYHITVASGITRPQYNIYYNDFGTDAARTGIVVNPAFDHMIMQGLSVGGEFRFR